MENGEELTKILAADFEDLSSYISDLMAAVPLPIYTVNSAGIIIDANKALVELTGYSLGELPGKRAHTIFLNEAAARSIEKETVEKGYVKGKELTVLTKDGEGILVSICAHARTDESGNVSYVATLMDITEHKKMKEQLQTISNLTRIITSCTNLSKVIESFAHELRKVSDFARLSILTIEADKLCLLAVYPKQDTGPEVGKTYPLEGSVTAWVKANKKAHIRSDFATTARQFTTDEAYLKNGFRAAICLPLFAHGEVFGSLNLTCSKPDAFDERYRGVLEQLAAQLGGAIENIRLYQLEKVQRQKLEQENNVRANFLNTLIHELSTPLTPLLSSGQLLAEQLEPKGGIEFQLIKNILDGAHILNGHLNELLELAKGEVGILQVNPEPLEPGEVIQGLASQCSAMFTAKGQEFHLEMESPLPNILADKERTGQVLLNLLTNATKFTPEGGEVTLRAKAEENALVIQVEDSGPGISAEKQAILSQPYLHLDSFSALGLGLAVSKRLVELQGGRIWAESEPGKGSTFSFSLPLASEEVVKGE